MTATHLFITLKDIPIYLHGLILTIVRNVTRKINEKKQFSKTKTPTIQFMLTSKESLILDLLYTDVIHQFEKRVKNPKLNALLDSAYQNQLKFNFACLFGLTRKHGPK